MYLPSFANLDLFSAGVNALDGVVVARNPSHNRAYTAAGLLIMAIFGGIGGGVSRDLLLNDISSPIKDPGYIFVCPAAGLLGLAIYRYAESKEEHFRKTILALAGGVYAGIRNSAARESEHAFLSCHPARGTGFRFSSVYLRCRSIGRSSCPWTPQRKDRWSRHRSEGERVCE
jgi:uncharacterized membrane protein YeiH